MTIKEQLLRQLGWGTGMSNEEPLWVVRLEMAARMRIRHEHGHKEALWAYVKKYTHNISEDELAACVGNESKLEALAAEILLTQ